MGVYGVTGARTTGATVQLLSAPRAPMHLRRMGGGTGKAECARMPMGALFTALCVGPPLHRWDIAMEYLPEDDSDEEEDGEGKGGQEEAEEAGGSESAGAEGDE